MFATAQTDIVRAVEPQFWSADYSLLHCICPGSEAPGTTCYTDYIVWQNGEIPSGLILTLPAPNQEENVCLL